MAVKNKVVRCGIVGYGGAFHMGRHHAEGINDAHGMQTVAVCDVDAKRLKAAERELPGVATFTRIEQLLRKGDVELVAIVTPHSTHAPLALKCLAAGKHVVIEKPFCITTREATRMIQAANNNKAVLTVYHNRRHDGDFMALMDILRAGIIGEVFHVEAFMGGYHKPRRWWRSDKRISGGAFYDWGAHLIDWVLHVCPYKIASVSGYFHKLVWKQSTNEDQVEAKIRFANGATADVQMSSIAAASKPRWHILGTKGAISSGPERNFTVTTIVRGRRAQMTWPYKDSTWHEYYPNLADHLLRGKPLEVTAESARRVIMVMDLAEQSSRKRRELRAPYE